MSEKINEEKRIIEENKKILQENNWPALKLSRMVNSVLNKEKHITCIMALCFSLGEILYELEKLQSGHKKEDVEKLFLWLLDEYLKGRNLADRKTTMKTEQTYIDKSSWPDGPWKEEPDRISWVDEKTGYNCLIRRHPYVGSLCGYVGVKMDHPFYGKHFPFK